MKNIFAVGTGPGAAEYLTLQAVNAIKNADIIFAPDNKGKQMALDTVKEFINGKKIILLDFPMGFVSQEHYKNAAEMIIEKTEEEKSSVILTIGDPMIYSTFIYLLPYFKKSKINLKIIPGITSFTAAAAISKTPLAKKGEVLTVTDHLNPLITANSDSIALLKTYKQKETAIGEFEKNGLDYVYIKRASLEGETVLRSNDKQKILTDGNYISLMLARKTNKTEISESKKEEDN
ncbi:precorrin-2 C(20)-methyltransferase [Treponema pedis]|uniref:Precorrin-2 C(20)-methyltransferase n=1 Tax=Treponema pedis TaxID=409322 RepID=A0A7S6WPZ2_9SPIR|nr:precorrin-2 C(20)-methyltransferase [Treponema pedis]QOW61183.1 precorrin-2 C(20)-methyltransferase [Treponema pedis]QSI04439.1 precorrin-2 C(20)-methyltransferase [Treponema pedis]